MPIYVFGCKACKLAFEELIRKPAEVKKIKCPECGKKKFERLLTMPNVHFADPTTSSKWENFGYRAGFNMNKAQNERRKAEAKSHMGSNPYLEQERCDIGTSDIENYEGKVV